jgi:hypothetical protein
MEGKRGNRNKMKETNTEQKKERMETRKKQST